MNPKNPIIIVQGAQFGSEAKGAVAARLCELRNVTHVVRTGTVNAGHTVHYAGQQYKMQQLPTGWVAPMTPLLFIGPGAYIHPEILAREIDWIETALGEKPSIFVDYRCGLHLPIHTERSTESGRHHAMGATGKGCSEAVIDKIKRRGDYGGVRLFRDWMDTVWAELQRGSGPHWSNALRRIEFVDVARNLNLAYDEGFQILIEGTQGTLLDLHLGDYPYTTHKQTQCGNWMAEAGLSPSLPTEICLVARTFPIRVAGNSGPMGNEISWSDLAYRINSRLREFGLPPRVPESALLEFDKACEQAAKSFPLERTPAYSDYMIESWPQEQREQFTEFVSELHKRALELLPGIVAQDLRRLFEMTTVTNKLRRVGELDIDALKMSIQLNRPAYLAFTFVNYLFPETWDQDWQQMDQFSRNDVLDWIIQMEYVLQTPIKLISTGAATNRVLEVQA